MRSLFGVVFISIALIGCASPLTVRHAHFYNAAGNEAAESGNWALAELNYERALTNARQGIRSSANESVALYNLGQAKGHLCKFVEAEKLLQEALEIEEKLSGAESGLTFMRLLELGRLQLGREQLDKAMPYFRRAVRLVEQLGLERTDPIGLALVYDDYAASTLGVGLRDESEAATEEAKRLRTEYAGLSAKFVPVSYEPTCQPR